MSIRRQSREFAIQLLYSFEFRPNEHQAGRIEKLAMQPKAYLRDFEIDHQIEPEVAQYGGTLFLGVCESREDIDRLIEAQARHWKLNRMGSVDLAILRTAVFEMKFLKPPCDPGVAINEAIELAKVYSSKDAPGFINGILDPIARAH